MKKMVLLVAVDVADDASERQMRSELAAILKPIRRGLLQRKLSHHTYQIVVKDMAWQPRKGVHTGMNLNAAIAYRERDTKAASEAPLRLNLYEQ
jgi:hypothetical protein